VWSLRPHREERRTTRASEERDERHLHALAFAQTAPS
jgi:hypothetical protein